MTQVAINSKYFKHYSCTISIKFNVHVCIDKHSVGHCEAKQIPYSYVYKLWYSGKHNIWTYLLTMEPICSLLWVQAIWHLKNYEIQTYPLPLWWPQWHHWEDPRLPRLQPVIGYCTACVLGDSSACNPTQFLCIRTAHLHKQLKVHVKWYIIQHIHAQVVHSNLIGNRPA